MGINKGWFEVENIIDNDYHIKFVLKNRWFSMGPFVCIWRNTRGAQIALSIVRACTICGDLPFLVGGDFNIIRNPLEKNN
jgi:hypothetical protein